MRFGIAVDLGSTEPAAGRVRRISPLLDHAEQAGVGAVWLGESYHRRPHAFHLPSPLLTLSHLAALTPLELGTGVLLVRAYDPARLALDAAMVDQISEGRLTLGLGLGPGHLRGVLGGPDKPGGRVLDELLAHLHTAWRDPDGGPDLVPAPARRTGPGLLIGGSGAPAVRRAVHAADGYYAATQYSDELLRTQCENYLAALPEGREPRIAVNRLCLLASDAQEARTRAADEMSGVMGFYRSMGQWNLGGADDTGLGPALIGSPEEIIDRLRTYRDWGVTEVQLRITPLDTAQRTSMRTLDLLGEQIIPALSA